MEDSSKDCFAINELLALYFRGIYEGSVGILRSVYHPFTSLYCDLEGQPRTKTLVLYLNGVSHRQSPKDSGKPFEADILSVDIVNSIGIARVRTRMYDSIK
jgi:Putative lumazine-binding